MPVGKGVGDTGLCMGTLSKTVLATHYGYGPKTDNTNVDISKFAAAQF